MNIKAVETAINNDLGRDVVFVLANDGLCVFSDHRNAIARSQGDAYRKQVHIEDYASNDELINKIKQYIPEAINYLNCL